MCIRDSSLAGRLFGHEAAAGQTILLNDCLLYTSLAEYIKRRDTGMAYDKATDRRSVKRERVNPMNDEQ